MAELDPKRVKEIEAEERARAEIRAKLEAERKQKQPPQQSAYKGFGCSLIIWGSVLAILSLFLGAFVPILGVMVLVFLGVVIIGILMWLVFG